MVQRLLIRYVVPHHGCVLKCVSCGKCAKVCKMDVDVTKTPNHTECIRCGMCVSACPTGAVSFRYGFGDGKRNRNMEENTEEST